MGEVTKYLGEYRASPCMLASTDAPSAVYNARKRGTDTAAKYFQRTQDIAGVEDMRFQVIGPPDVLHWLGITKIDK